MTGSLKKPKGSQCSVSGNNYEKQVHNVTKNCYINDKPFNLLGNLFKAGMKL